MQPHEQRVVDEKKELDEKLEKLYHFAITNQPNPIFTKLTTNDKKLLTIQYRAMYVYSEVLEARIERFKKDS